MASFTVTIDIINSPQAQDYFTRADRRVMIGLRATLELLKLPVPDYALRRKPGRTPAKDVAAACAAGMSAPRPMTLPKRKPSASSAVVAAAKAAREQRLGQEPSTLFQDTFG